MNKPDNALALQCEVELSDANESDDSGCTLTLRIADAESLLRLRKALARNGRQPQYVLHLLKMDEGSADIDPLRRSRLEDTLKIEPLSRNAFAVKTRFPSGVITIPQARFPTGIYRSTLWVLASITATVLPRVSIVA